MFNFLTDNRKGAGGSDSDMISANTSYVFIFSRHINSFSIMSLMK